MKFEKQEDRFPYAFKCLIEDEGSRGIWLCARILKHGFDPSIFCLLDVFLNLFHKHTRPVNYSLLSVSGLWRANERLARLIRRPENQIDCLVCFVAGDGPKKWMTLERKCGSNSKK